MSSLTAFAVVVHLSNLAGVPAHIVGAAQAEVTRTFAEAGVAIEWAGPSQPYTVGQSDVLRLHLVAQETGNLKRRIHPVLGAAVTTELGTRVAWVYYQRVEAEAARSSVRASLVLASAIAHEIGHLLLPGRVHATTGLMRACWDDGDFQRAARGTLRFSPAEGAEIRAGIAATSATRTVSWP